MNVSFSTAVVIVGVIASANGQPVTSVRLNLPPSPMPLVENIGRVFTRQVQSRCAAQVVVQGDAPLVVELAIEPDIGAEGFKIADGAKGTVRIIGNDERGLLYGVGKFLHTSAFGDEGVTPSAWRGTSIPKSPMRGIYFATHFQNYYQMAPVEEVRQYVEDMGLWGYNNLLVWFGMEEFNGIADPKAQAMLERLRVLLKTAKDIGLDVGLGCVGNDGYKNSPKELRATMVKFDLGVELCPNKPGVMDLEVQFVKEKCEAFKSVGLDYWFIAPYDNGGCGCAKCIPWGINGFLKVAEPEARAFRSVFPKGKVVISTWYFDHPDLFKAGEWAGLTEKFGKQKPDWVDYIMADNFAAYPRYPLDKGVPGGLPLINFPDISMWGQDPWGGYGANPIPGRLQTRWDEAGAKLSGGIPYSEGRYEDLNKAICAQFYWAPERTALETVREYIAFEFSPEVVDDVMSAVKIFEQNHWRKNIGESAVTACQLLEKADAKLTPQARRSWRWRLFMIRAMVDQELYRDKSLEARDDVFQKVYDELLAISHSEKAWHMIRPQLIRAKKKVLPATPSGLPDKSKGEK